jgi:hypothetical protein
MDARVGRVPVAITLSILTCPTAANPVPLRAATVNTNQPNQTIQFPMSSESSPLPELPAVGFLADVPADHRTFLTGFGRFLRFFKDDTVIVEGAPQNSLSMVLIGVLNVVSTEDGNTTLLATLGAGDSIGEVNIFDPGTASATVVARSSCVLWSLTHEELDAIVEADAAIGLSVMKGLLRQLSCRIRQMNAKLATSERWIHDYWKAGQK